VVAILVAVMIVIVIVVIEQVFRCTRQYFVAPASRVNCIKEQITLRFVAQIVLNDQEGQTRFRYISETKGPGGGYNGVK
jgi:hypothetical protein